MKNKFFLIILATLFTICNGFAATKMEMYDIIYQRPITVQSNWVMNPGSKVIGNINLNGGMISNGSGQYLTGVWHPGDVVTNAWDATARALSNNIIALENSLTNYLLISNAVYFVANNQAQQETITGSSPAGLQPQFTNEIIDTKNAYNRTNSTFTPPTNGVYKINVVMYTQHTDPGASPKYHQLSLYTNSVLLTSLALANDYSGGAATVMNGNTSIYLRTNMAIKVYVYTTCQNAYTVAGSCWFSAELMR